MQSFFLSIVIAVSLVGCAGDKGAASSPQVAAPEKIGEAFSVGKDARTGQPAVAIRKDSLEKEFLIQSALIEQTVAAMGSSLKSRVVAFKRHGNQLLLVEATAGHTVTSDLPQNLILTSFPILEETADNLLFDFNAGMKVILTSSEWAAHDSRGTAYAPSFNFADVHMSYLEEVKFVPPNRLAIRQIAQVPQSGFLSGSSLSPMEVRYFLSPYRPNPAFKASREADFKRAGFFEVAPRLRMDGGTDIYSTKFDVQAPITFAISANAPADYRQAMKDGINYWKGVLPNIQVIDAPAGVTAPDIHYNVIQWVPYDTAGMAYADAQMDPRTGEVLHAQAFITSTFAFSGRNKVRALLRRLEEPKPKPKTRVGLNGFEMEKLCNFDPSESLKRSLGELLSVQASDAAILRVSQDYVRAVVAHEVGHLLGLRHNFAGSLSVKDYPLDRRDEIFARYLTSDTVPYGVQTSSTEMDYLPMEESAIHGHQMRTQPGQVYPYDRAALEMLYFDKNPDARDMPPFCTDRGSDKYTDCQQHDAGISKVEYAAYTTRKAIDTLANRLVETFISVKAPAPGESSRPVESVNLDPEKIASGIVAPLDGMLQDLAADKRSLLIAREFPFVGPLNREDVQAKELKAIQGEVDRLGGWEKVLGLFNHDGYERVLDETERLLRDPAYKSGLGLGGQSYSFSEEEVQNMLNTVLNLAVKLPDAMVKVDIEMVKRFPDRWKVTGTKTGDELARIFGKRSEEYVLTTNPTSFIQATAEVPAVAPALVSSLKAITGTTDDKDKKDEKTEAPKMKSVTLKLPVFTYSQDLREKAALLLAPATNPDGIDWGFAERAHMKAEFKKLVDGACGCDFSATSVDKFKIADAGVKRRVTRWFLENKKILLRMP